MYINILIFLESLFPEQGDDSEVQATPQFSESLLAKRRRNTSNTTSLWSLSRATADAVVDADCTRIITAPLPVAGGRGEGGEGGVSIVQYHRLDAVCKEQDLVEGGKEEEEEEVVEKRSISRRRSTSRRSSSSRSRRRSRALYTS